MWQHVLAQLPTPIWQCCMRGMSECMHILGRGCAYAHEKWPSPRSKWRPDTVYPSISPIFSTNGLSCSFLPRGRTEQLIGATEGGRASHILFLLCSRTLNVCSKMEYMIRPIPKDDSMTDGTTLTTRREEISIHKINDHIIIMWL